MGGCASKVAPAPDASSVAPAPEIPGNVAPAPDIPGNDPQSTRALVPADTEAANPPPTNDELREHLGWLEKVDLSSESEMELDGIFRGVTTVLFDSERQNPVMVCHAGNSEAPVNESDAEAYRERRELAYEVLLRIIKKMKDGKGLHKLAKRNEEKSGDFIRNMLELFDEPDSRLRDLVKWTTHEFYAKVMTSRKLFRKGFSSLLYRFVFETERHNGIAETLEMVASYAQGFNVPLKPEHVSFLKKVVLPLYKVHLHLPEYQLQLDYCTSSWIKHDKKLLGAVIDAILRFWVSPQTCLLYTSPSPRDS